MNTKLLLLADKAFKQQESIRARSDFHCLYTMRKL